MGRQTERGTKGWLVNADSISKSSKIIRKGALASSIFEKMDEYQGG